MPVAEWSTTGFAPCRVPVLPWSLRREEAIVDEYLTPTWFIDSDAPCVRDWAFSAAAGAGPAASPNEQAVLLYNYVRDQIRYDPYKLVADPEAYRASVVLQSSSNWCVPKAVLLAAGARVLGIPSRLGFADVRNHLTSEKLRASMDNDLFVRHGFTELHLDGRWIRVTPTFNRELCDRFGLMALEFDGHHDALFHPFDQAGNQHMEYVRYYPVAADLPLDEVLADLRAAYGELLTEESTVTDHEAHDPVFHD